MTDPSVPEEKPTDKLLACGCRCTHEGKCDGHKEHVEFGLKVKAVLRSIFTLTDMAPDAPNTPEDHTVVEAFMAVRMRFRKDPKDPKGPPGMFTEFACKAHPGEDDERCYMAFQAIAAAALDAALDTQLPGSGKPPLTQAGFQVLMARVNRDLQQNMNNMWAARGMTGPGKPAPPPTGSQVSN